MASAGVTLVGVGAGVASVDLRLSALQGKLSTYHLDQLGLSQAAFACGVGFFSCMAAMLRQVHTSACVNDQN